MPYPCPENVVVFGDFPSTFRNLASQLGAPTTRGGGRTSTAEPDAMSRVALFAQESWVPWLGGVFFSLKNVQKALSIIFYTFIPIFLGEVLRSNNGFQSVEAKVLF